MINAAVAFKPVWPDTKKPGTESDISDSVLLLAGLLAASGLVELVLQRVVYRVGLHIPRDGAFRDAYHLTTLAGDFGFRLAAVFLLLACIAGVVWLLSRSDTFVTGLFLGALAVVNVLAWLLTLSWAPLLIAFTFVFMAVWLVGRHSPARDGGILFRIGVGAAGIALALGYYGSGMVELAGRPEPLDVATLQLASEALLLAAAFVTGWVAVSHGRKKVTWPIVAGVLMATVLFAGYAREPATVAITSLWAIGFTMSLPAVLYFAAFAAAVAAVLVWLPDASSRHLAIGAVLILIAGLQPQALHHSLTASLGLILLYSGPPGSGSGNKLEGDTPNAAS
jgi:hypothetical protein